MRNCWIGDREPNERLNMIMRFMGVLIALASAYFYVFHIAKWGEEPHTFWALLAGIVLMIGLWLALPGRRTKK